MRRPLAVLALSLCAACGTLPTELNLAPFYRHRLADDRSLLELDVAWPLIHYERTPSGGDDLRIRPLWRRVIEGDRTEHQFLWPFGRVVKDSEEIDARLFPLWTWRWRLNGDDLRENEWEAPYPVPIWPFLAGGSEPDADGRPRRYFGFHPIYADLPGYATYDRFRSILFPLYAGTVKGDVTSHNFLFWLIGFGGRAAAPFERWHRALPLYAAYDHPGKRNAYALLWPLLTWGQEKLDTDDPVRRFMLWPLFGYQRSKTGATRGWSVLWPFFQELTAGERYYRLDFLWPLFRYLRNDKEDRPFTQWWLWPFVARTDGRYQQAWSFAWPLIWWRKFQDPDGDMTQLWLLPLWWSIEQQRKDGRSASFWKLWPVMHHARKADGTGDWSVPSPWPWREGNAYGVQESYGFLWTLAQGRRYAPDDRGMSLTGNLFTKRRTGGTLRWSVPFLCSYEGTAQGGTLRLLQCIPIGIGGSQ